MSGETLALLPGWGMNAAVFDAIRPALAARWRLADVDLPGHGARHAPLPGNELGAWAAAIAARLPERCLLLAWSLGALVALRIATAHPGLLRRLVVVSATPRFLAGEDGWPGVDPAEFRRFATQLQRDPAGALRRFHGLQAQGDDRSRPVLRDLERAAAATPAPEPAALEAGLGLLCDSDLRTELAGIQAPTLVIGGAADRLAPPAAGEFLAKWIPGARSRLVAGAAHAPFISDPVAFFAEINAFLCENDQ